MTRAPADIKKKLPSMRAMPIASCTKILTLLCSLQAADQEAGDALNAEITVGEKVRAQFDHLREEGREEVSDGHLFDKRPLRA